MGVPEVAMGVPEAAMGVPEAAMGVPDCSGKEMERKEKPKIRFALRSKR